MLKHDILAVAFSLRPCLKYLPGPRRRHFTFPYAGKFLSLLEPGQVSLQGQDFYCMEEFKMFHSWDRKTFPAFGNAKGLLKNFLTWGNVIKIYGWWKKYPGINSGIVYPWQ
jgi:hypothetical protein